MHALPHPSPEPRPSSHSSPSTKPVYTTPSAPLQVPDLDGGLGGSAQPVAVGGEAQGVDDVTSVQGVQALALRQVPQHGNTILATGGAQGAIGGDSHGVDVASVADQVVLQLAVGQVPHLDLWAWRKRFTW